MPKIRMALTATLFLAMSALGATPSRAMAAPAALQLWRLDCGEIQMNDAAPLSDTGAYDGRSRRLSNGCYLIRHGADYLLWDAGLPVSLLGKALDAEPISATLRQDLTSQLARIGVRPEQIGRLAISHYHFDHVGQAALFPGATLLIGAADLKALRGAPPAFADPSLLEHWLKGAGAIDAINGDRDVFGDGSVTILGAPGHTPGELALLVRLPKTGPVILTGDVAHLESQLAPRHVPTWNTDRAESLASIDRLVKLAATLKARIIVQHDPGDVRLLARFPDASR